MILSCELSQTAFIAFFLRWESLAVLLAICYLLLAIRQNIGCWAAAFGSTFIYTLLYWDVTLYMESLLNIYYMAMAVYGWWQWRSGALGIHRPIVRWSWKKHTSAVLIIGILTAISGYMLNQNTDARLPYLDSFTTWGAVITTFMVAKKVLENWFYWIIINSVGIYLNIDRCLLMTALLLCSYQLMSVFGFLQWRKSYYEQG